MNLFFVKNVLTRQVKLTTTRSSQKMAKFEAKIIKSPSSLYIYKYMRKEYIKT